MDTTIRYPLLS